MAPDLASLVVDVTADPRGLIKVARVIAKHMTALADDLEKLGDSAEAASVGARKLGRAFEPTSAVVERSGLSTEAY